MDYFSNMQAILTVVGDKITLIRIAHTLILWQILQNKKANLLVNPHTSLVATFGLTGITSTGVS